MAKPHLALLDPEADDNDIDAFLGALGAGEERAAQKDDDTDHYYGAWYGGKASQGGHPGTGPKGGYSSTHKSASGVTHGAAVAGMAPHASPQNLAETTKRIQQVRGGEELHVFNADGSPIATKKNDGKTVEGGYGVSVTKAELAQMKGKVVLHNHPTGWDYDAWDPRRAGNSFSDNDIALAIEGHVAEMRVITPTREFVMKPRDGGTDWHTDEKGLAVALHTIVPQVMADAWKRIYSGHDDGWGADQATREAWAETQHWDSVWRRIAPEFDWTYTDTPVLTPGFDASTGVAAS